MEKFDLGLDENLATEKRTASKSPPMYKVFLMNDDYTTMDFVVHILESVFRKPVVEATQIMLHVHNHGKGLAGVYTHEIAETKINTVHQLSHQKGFPLKCTMEKE
ncbi:MAG: ATP-dependent Clp protease adapter ClpS [Nitrospirota bacterium]